MFKYPGNKFLGIILVLGLVVTRTPVLAMSKSLADDLDQQKVAAFTLWFVPEEGAASGTVRLQLDGVDLGEFPVGNQRYAITLLARTGSIEHLQITADQTQTGPIVYRA